MDLALLVIWTAVCTGAGWTGCWAVSVLRRDAEEDRLARREAAELEARIEGNRTGITDVTRELPAGEFETQAGAARAAARERAMATDPELAAAYAAKAGPAPAAGPGDTLCADTLRITDPAPDADLPRVARNVFAQRGFHMTGDGEEHAGLREDCAACVPRSLGRWAGSRPEVSTLILDGRPGGRRVSNAEFRPAEVTLRGATAGRGPAQREQARGGSGGRAEGSVPSGSSPGAPEGAEDRGSHIAGSSVHAGSRWACGSAVCRVTEAQYQQALGDPEQDFFELLGASRAS